MRIAVAQIVSGADPHANLDQVAELTATAAADGAELVVFPEATMRCFGRSLVEVAEPLDGPWSKGLIEIADRHGVVVVAGMFTPADGGRVANTLRVVGRGIDEHYDKIHLYDAFGFTESETVAPGTELLVVRVGELGVGFATCYDLRFPGLFTALAERGAQLICVPASWGAGPGKLEQWQLLLRARALDCTSYLAAAGPGRPDHRGRAGDRFRPDRRRSQWGRRPRRNLLAGLGAEPGLLVVDIEPEVVAATRRQIPVLANRRI